MPRAHISEIQSVEPSTRRVTGSFDPPLNFAGRAQSARLAMNLHGRVDHVFTSPARRSLETAHMISPAAKIDPGLAPMRLGVHEGKPADAARPHIQSLFHPGAKPPGASPLTGKPGEAGAQFSSRMLHAVAHHLAVKKPKDTVVAVTHGRNIKAVDSWLHAGAKPSLAIDTAHMTSKTAEIAPGDLYHVNTAKRMLEKVKAPIAGGFHLARHGATAFNDEGAGKGRDTGS